MDYLTKIRQTFYCRLPIPKELQQYFSTKEFKKSLHTKDRKQAKLLLITIVSDMQAHFFRLRYLMEQRPPTFDAIEICKKMYPDITEFSSTFKDGRGRLRTEYPPRLMHIQDALDVGVEPNKDGILIITDEYDHKIKLRYSRPNRQYDTDLVPSEVIPTPISILFSKASEDYLNESEFGTAKKRSLVKNTIGSYRGTLKRFDVFTKKCDLVSAVNQGNSYIDYRLQSGLKKTSVNSDIRNLKVFFDWCVNKKYINSYPKLESCTESNQEKWEKGNHVYVSDDIQKIINALSEVHYTDIRRRERHLSFTYFCLVLLFTGLRCKSEAMQLQKSDFKVIDGINAIDLGAGKELKSINSYRIIPIHKKLEDLDLLKFADRAQNLIFTSCYGYYAKALNDILYRVGIKTRKYEYLFHSFRHAFDSSMDALGTVPDTHRSMLMGHARTGMDKIYLSIIEEHLPRFNKSVQSMSYNYDFSKLKIFLRNELNTLY